MKTTVEINNELWMEFQRAILRKYGRIYGNTQKALEEAIREWIEKHGGTS